MKTIKFEKHLTYEESANWIKDNRNDLIFTKHYLTVDMSEVVFVHNNILGFIINLLYTRKQNNLKTRIIPPQAGFMKTIFKEIGV